MGSSCAQMQLSISKKAPRRTEAVQRGETKKLPFIAVAGAAERTVCTVAPARGFSLTLITNELNDYRSEDRNEYNCN